jgi:hypothetical protein
LTRQEGYPVAAMTRTAGKWVVLASLCSLALSACGSTVQQSGQPPTVDGPATQPVVTGDVGGGTTGLGVPPGEGAPPGGAPSTRSGPGSAVSGESPESSGRPGSGITITRPLTVGLLGIASNTKAAGSAGVNVDQGLSPSQALRAMANSYREAGGIGGRPLRTVVAEIDPGGDYQGDLEAACAKFTQDSRVDVVISIDAVYDDRMSECLTTARIPRISTGNTPGNAASLDRYPHTRYVGSPNADRRVLTLTTRSSAAGMLTRQSNVGVVVEDCPSNQAVYEHTALPALRRAGVAAVTVATTNCITSFSSQGGAASQMSSALLRFRSRNVNAVMFVSNFEPTLLLFFSQAAESQQYRPKYLLTSLSAVANIQSNLPPGQMTGMSGWGWAPTTDRTRGNTAQTAPQRTCLKRFAATGTHVNSNLDYWAAYSACDGFAVLERALIGSRGDTRPASLLAALDAASSSLRLAFLVDGQVLLTARRHDGPSHVRRFAYYPRCSCFDYSGRAEEMSR